MKTADKTNINKSQHDDSLREDLNKENIDNKQSGFGSNNQNLDSNQEGWTQSQDIDEEALEESTP